MLAHEKLFPRARSIAVSEAQPADSNPAPHVPVLITECLQALNVRAGGVYLDGTFGAGGYSRALLAAGAEVIALDRDPRAISAGAALAAESSGRLKLVEGRFGDLDAIAKNLGFDKLDGVALDIGVSSMQLDEAERGFSLRFDAPLDMRMEGKGRTAADILLEEDEAALADILFHYGEERAARKIARAVVADRANDPYVSTLQLARMIQRVAPARPGELTHPATRTFQALRIAVNDELGQLLRGLAGAERILAPGGRLAVVTFHSLEDRIVKQFFARRAAHGRAVSRRLPGEPPVRPPSFSMPSRQPVVPGAAEIAANSRARSAKLRCGERTKAAPFEIDAELAALTRLPQSRARRH
jgi:16S rRNA (cytosine1402-N4)-methyltransferase